MNNFMNGLRHASTSAGQGEARTRIGTVTSYDPGTYSAKVLLQPEGVETGWLPIATIWSGNGWGLFSPPTSGDMVHVEFQEASTDAGMIVGRFYNDQERPLPAPSGELWMVHQSGSLMKFHNDGSVELVTAQDLNVSVGGAARIASTGDMTLSSSSSLHLSAPRIDLN